MTSQSIAPKPFFPSKQETEELQALEKQLAKTPSHAKLVGIDGDEIDLPDPIYRILQAVVHLMAMGQAVTLVPLDHELSTQQAANLLNVSRPFLNKLVDGGEIPYRKVGSHRRIRCEDLMEYKKQRDLTRHESLNELMQFSQDEGFYDA